MRIGVDASILQGDLQEGIARYLEALLDAARSLGEHTFFLYTPGPLAERLPRGPDVVERRVRWRRGWFNWGLPLRALADQLDVFFAPTLLVPLPFLLLGRPRTVVMFHDANQHLHPEWFPPQQHWRHRFYGRLSATRAWRVITPSESARADLTAALDVAETKVSVVPEAAAAHFRPLDRRAAKAAVAAAFGLTGPYILHVGAIHPKRNVPRLIAAMRRARTEGGIPHQLVLVGQRQWPPSLLDEALEANQAHEWVRHLSRVTDADLVQLYSAADAVAYVSLSEGFGLPPLEAMACGTPVVASRISSIPEVTGDAALLVDPLDDAAIAAGLVTAATDARRRVQLAAAGRARAAMFSWQRAAEQTLELLDNGR